MISSGFEHENTNPISFVLRSSFCGLRKGVRKTKPALSAVEWASFNYPADLLWGFRRLHKNFQKIFIFLFTCWIIVLYL